MKNNFYVSFIIWLVIWIMLWLLFNYICDLFIIRSLDKDLEIIISEIMKLKENQDWIQSSIYEINKSLQDWEIIPN